LKFHFLYPKDVGCVLQEHERREYQVDDNEKKCGRFVFFENQKNTVQVNCKEKSHKNPFCSSKSFFYYSSRALLLHYLAPLIPLKGWFCNRA